MCLCGRVYLLVIICALWMRGRWSRAGGEHIIGFRSKRGRGKELSACRSPWATPSWPWIIDYPCLTANSVWTGRWHLLTISKLINLGPTVSGLRRTRMQSAVQQSPRRSQRQQRTCSVWCRIKCVSKEFLVLSFSLARDCTAQWDEPKIFCYSRWN